MLRSSIRRTPSQLHSLQQIPTQHDMLPQHLVYRNELNREYVITLARNDENPWRWSEKIETCRSGFKWKLYRCICWLIVEVVLRNARCNNEIHDAIFFQSRVTTSLPSGTGQCVYIVLQYRIPLCKVDCRMQNRQCDVSRRQSQTDINNKISLFLYFSYEMINSLMLSEYTKGTAVTQLVEALSYKPGGRGFDSR